MKKMIGGAMLVATLIGVPAAALADGWYLGVKGGQVMPDPDGFGDATNVGVVLGYDILDVGFGDVSLEGDLTTTMDKGSTPGNSEWEMDTFGGYAVFRTAGPMYLKAKGGFTRTEFQTNNFEDSETDASVGVGLGFSIGLAQLEIEYTEIEDDFDFLSLTVNFF